MQRKERLKDGERGNESSYYPDKKEKVPAAFFIKTKVKEICDWFGPIVCVCDRIVL